MGVVSSLSRNMLHRSPAFTTAVERTNSTADQRNDCMSGTVKHRFMQMMEVHDRMRARFLATAPPGDNRNTAN